MFKKRDFLKYFKFNIFYNLSIDKICSIENKIVLLSRNKVVEESKRYRTKGLNII